MKNTIFVGLAFFALLVCILPVVAQEAEEPNETAEELANVTPEIPENVTEELPDAGICPDSPFHGLDKWFENVHIYFTGDMNDKAMLRLEQTKERLAEVKCVADKGRDDLVDDAIDDYEDYMNESKEYGAHISELAKQKEFEEKLEAAHMVHIVVLQGVYEKVPEQAKPAVAKAINRSSEQLEETRVKVQELKEKAKEHKELKEKKEEGEEEEAPEEGAEANESEEGEEEANESEEIGGNES